MQYAELAQSSLVSIPATGFLAVANWARGLVHSADYWQPDDITAIPSVEEIRSLLHFAYHTPVGTSKIALIPHADLWRREVSNMLLKLIEEPPSYLKLVLLASGSLLLPTIRSRVSDLVLPVAITGTHQVVDSGAQGWSAYLENYPKETEDQLGALQEILYRTPLLHSTIQHDIVQEGFLP